jgi:hypothetical protein
MFSVAKTISATSDSLILLFRDAQKIASFANALSNSKLGSDITNFLEVDQSAVNGGTHLVLSEGAPGKRVILAPIGNKLFSDTADVRDIANAARAAIKKAVAAGSVNPVVSFAIGQGEGGQSLQAGSLHAKLWQARYAKYVEVR